MTKPTASIFTGPEGHLSIAESAGSGIKAAGYNPVLNPIHGKEFGLYMPFYLLFPQLFKIPFILAENEKAQSAVKTFAKISYQDKLLKQLTEQKPKVVVSTWFMHNVVLEQANILDSFLFVNIIADPRTFPSISINKHAYNLVFDKAAADRCRSLGVPKEKIIESGWFVRDRFEEKYDIRDVRKKLKLDPDRFTILILSGSEGTAAILKILPAFYNCKYPLEVVVACGANKQLHSTVSTLTKIVQTTQGKSNVRITPLGFTKNIHLYLQAADLAVGKAGPNFLFESVATRTPFLAITHIAGQEDGNLDIIRQYKLGYVEENPLKAIKLLKHLIEHPGDLKKLENSIEKMAVKNENSKKILADLIRSKA